MKCNEEQVRALVAASEGTVIGGSIAALAADWLELVAERDSLCKWLADAEAKRQPVEDHDLRRGGKWLGAARKWLQWNKRNGDRVTWGSSDVLEPAFTARDAEDLALAVAVAAINADRAKEGK